IAVEIDFPWGTMTSLEHPLDRREIPVSFEVDKKLQKSLEEALQDHVDLYLASWQKNDITKLGHLSDSLQETYQYEIESDNDSAENGSGRQNELFARFSDNDNVRLDFAEGNYYLIPAIKKMVRPPFTISMTIPIGRNPRLIMNMVIRFSMIRKVGLCMTR